MTRLAQYALATAVIYGCLFLLDVPESESGLDFLFHCVGTIGLIGVVPRIIED